MTLRTSFAVGVVTVGLAVGLAACGSDDHEPTELSPGGGQPQKT